MQNTQAVFLDIDGTLVDSNEFHVSAWAHAFQKNGVPMQRDRIRKHIGKGKDKLIPDLLPDSTDRLRASIGEAHDEQYQSELLPRVKAFPHASDFVSKLHRLGLKVLLASSAKKAEVEHYVKLLGVESILDGTTSADDVEQSKPAGDIFAAALKKVAPITAAETVVIGDTPYDVIAARKCGIRAIGLLSGGFSAEELTDAGAIAVFDSVGELLSSWEPKPAS
jgi:HAD superfamily hydrolase (TIGR01509 family)